jgi:ABC-type transport system involved in cytochrome c biogenesis permease component
METTEEKKCCEPKKCCCHCHKMGGVFIILIGVLALLLNLDVITDHVMWIAISIIIILVGLCKLARSFCKCCTGGGCKK